MQRLMIIVCFSALSLSLTACGRQTHDGLVNPLYPQQALPAVQPPLPRIYPLMPVGSKQTAQAGDRAVATPNGYVYMSEIPQPGAQQYNCAGTGQQMNHSISQGIQNPCSGTGVAQSTSYGNTYPQTPSYAYGNTGQTATYPNNSYPATSGASSAYPNSYPSSGQNTSAQTTYSSYNQRRR